MFRFRFESLLVHRRHEEETAQKRLHEAQTALQDCRQRLRQLRRERHAAVLRLKDSQQGVLDTGGLAMAMAHLARLDAGLERRQEEVRRAERALSDRRRALAEAVKRRKMIEKLKEKDLRRHQEDGRRRENRHLDEVAAGRHARSRG